MRPNNIPLMYFSNVVFLEKYGNNIHLLTAIYAVPVFDAYETPIKTLTTKT